jgi:hypothetical protein
VTSSYFHVLDESAESGRYRATPATVGPWSPDLQHGGPPNALAVAAAERLVAEQTGRTDLIAMRIASEFVGPVPVAEVTTEARAVRVARNAALVGVVLRSGDRECLQARVWLVRDGDTSRVAQPPRPVPDLPDTGTALDARFGYGDSLEWRGVRGGITQTGPGAAWVRARTDVVPGSPPRGLQFAALVGDSASGISAELDWKAWTFLNVDLDVHLARPVEGEWLHLDATTQLGGHGSALTRSTLYDTTGPVGATLQTLVVAPVRR